MSTWKRVAIVGVGLIGGSIGLALRERKLAKRVVGIGRDASKLIRAKSKGAIDEGKTDVASGVAGADVIVVCTPVDSVVEIVAAAAAACPPKALLTDAASTKSDIVARLTKRLKSGVRFVGSHPLAGSEKSGVAAARANLFDGRRVVVTPTDSTPREAAQGIGEFWSALGAEVVAMSPDEHDQTVAATSHLPHLLSSILAATTPEGALPLTATGWRDMTRIAGGDPELWRQIFATNKAHVLTALGRFEKVLTEARRALGNDDPALVELVNILTEGKRRRDAVGS